MLGVRFLRGLDCRRSSKGLQRKAAEDMEEGGKGYRRVDVYHRWYTEVPLVGHGSPISGTWKSHLWDTPMECSLTLLAHSHQTWGTVHPPAIERRRF